MVNEAHLFQGSAIAAIDEDGNVAVPDFIAEGIRAGADTGDVLLARQIGDLCLTAFHRAHLGRIHQRAERRRQRDEEAGLDESAHRARARRAFGLVEGAACRDGRLRLPPAMRHLGGIDGLALFVGAGETFEIWNPDLALETDDEEFRELVAYRVAEYRGEFGGVLQ